MNMSSLNINNEMLNEFSTVNNHTSTNTNLPQNNLNQSYNLNRISSKEGNKSNMLSSLNNTNNNTTNNTTNNNISTAYHTTNLITPSNTKHIKEISKDQLPSAQSTTMNKKNDEKVKEFFLRQNKILEEMSGLKDDLQFILENKKKTKLLEKIQQGVKDSSICLDESSFLNQSFTSNVSTQTVKKKFNIKDKFDNKNFVKFQEFLNSYKHNRQVLLLVDNKNRVWELVKRNDLNIYSLARENENLVSITSALQRNDLLNIEDSPKSKLLNIEIKDNYDNRSLNNSELDISKVSEFNISHYIRETCNDMSLIH